ncbi:unnamed protein product [Hymenolepis diminuta]|uniref:Uncharacterized protein n=1 Tax=Hymenolepis diminuta TaxID=6216 RepID=A0A564Z6Q7_HYMDI|nr:unnamed protein product [Hymenolepis diminuta]
MHILDIFLLVIYTTIRLNRESMLMEMDTWKICLLKVPSRLPKNVFPDLIDNGFTLLNFNRLEVLMSAVIWNKVIKVRFLNLRTVDIKTS